MPRPDSSDPSLDALLGKLRAEPPPAHVDAVTRALPARVGARLREEASAGGSGFGLSCLRWMPALAGVTVLCAAIAVLGVRSRGLDALGDPQVAGWFVLLFG